MFSNTANYRSVMNQPKKLALAVEKNSLDGRVFSLHRGFDRFSTVEEPVRESMAMNSKDDSRRESTLRPNSAFLQKNYRIPSANNSNRPFSGKFSAERHGDYGKISTFGFEDTIKLAGIEPDSPKPASYHKYTQNQSINDSLLKQAQNILIDESLPTRAAITTRRLGDTCMSTDRTRMTHS